MKTITPLTLFKMMIDTKCVERLDCHSKREIKFRGEINRKKLDDKYS